MANTQRSNGNGGDPEPATAKGRRAKSHVSTKLQRIAELARLKPEMVFTSLAHHIDVECLREAFRRTRKTGAAGVDGQTAREYEENLDENLRSLHERFRSGRYKAPPVRRVHIPKGDGRTRPIGIPTIEDKILQRSVTMLLEAIYEQDFLDCSHGFRPGRSAHDALQEVWQATMDVAGGFVLELDIEGFFDAIDHGHLRTMLDQRMRDGVLRRQLDKWLAAGVMEGGKVHYPETGSPQGGVVSPILANVYLHHALDVWFTDGIQPQLRGRSRLIRYADDAVLVFEREEDARQVLGLLPERFARFGLRLHPEKTRLVDFRRPPRNPPESGGDRDKPGRPEKHFDLLAFRHYWGKSRKGNPVVMRKTSPGRFTRARRKVTEWCRINRHTPVAVQHAALTRKLQGHYNYFGITGNGRSLSCFLFEVERGWRKWLSRRSHHGRMNWNRFRRLLARFPLPPPRVVHSVYRP